MDIIIPLASGFEEIEAVTIIDILRRAGLSALSAAVSENPVKGAHNIEIKADIALDSVNAASVNAVVVPGGMPGADNLRNSELLISLISDVYKKGGYAAAICAGPIVLAKAGVLKDKKVTCFPGYQNNLNGGIYESSPLQIDGRVITGEGPGCSMDFALALVGLLAGRKLSEDIRKSARVYWA